VTQNQPAFWLIRALPRGHGSNHYRIQIANGKATVELIQGHPLSVRSTVGLNLEPMFSQGDGF
jgi:hypothetical protein